MSDKWRPIIFAIEQTSVNDKRGGRERKMRRRRKRRKREEKEEEEERGEE